MKIGMAMAVQALVAWLASVAYHKGLTFESLQLRRLIEFVYPPSVCGLLHASEFVIASRNVVLEGSTTPAAGTPEYFPICADLRRRTQVIYSRKCGIIHPVFLKVSPKPRAVRVRALSVPSFATACLGWDVAF